MLSSGNKLAHAETGVVSSGTPPWIVGTCGARKTAIQMRPHRRNY